MPDRSSTGDTVGGLRDDLTQQRAAIRELHDRGLAGTQVSAKLASLIDSIVTRLFNAALDELDPEAANALRANVAIMALGSYGRRQCAPFSDVDLMILHQGKNQDQIASQLRPMTQGIFDVGLQLGHSVRTVNEAVQLARNDAVICTSLIDTRPILGKQSLHDAFRTSFEKMVRRNHKTLCRSFLDAREIERDQYGETVNLLEPHVKKSRGGLRDMNLLRWLGFAEHGVSDPDRLHLAGALSKLDQRRWLSAREYLLRIRNEMHFHAGGASDLLDRAEQLRLAQWIGHPQRSGLLPVEYFMRDYFRHTTHIWRQVRRRDASLQVVSRVSQALDPVLGKNIAGDYRIGLSHVSATPAGIEKLKRDVGEVLRLVEISAREKKHLDHRTFSVLLLAAPDFPDDVADEVGEQFYDQLADPVTVGEIVRVLHELGFLEKIIPAFRHARCLLQFNQYHKFTVDEHSLRAVRKAAAFAERDDALGAAYRDIEDKRVLHLALLLHDLGKGFEEDHSEVGKRIAKEMTALLRLDESSAADVIYLVHQHLVMAHLTFRRDTSDEQLIAGFAKDVGSVQRLRMLFVLTCADLDAVGPGVLNDWKVDVLANVYARSVRMLQGDDGYETELEAHRRTILKQLTAKEQADDWFDRQIASLSPSYLAEFDVAEVVAALRRFHSLPDSGVDVWGLAQPELEKTCFVAGVNQGIGRGVFSSMAGALTSAGMQIISAHTDMLADGLLLLRFDVVDASNQGKTSPERVKKICQSLEASIDSDEPPHFPQVWGEEKALASIQLSMLPNEVRIDNDLSADYTIVEVFTFDRKGLLYSLARRLHELSLIIGHAKISTYLDQVVDVFYITDRQGNKVANEGILANLCEELLKVIQRE